MAGSNSRHAEAMYILYRNEWRAEFMTICMECSHRRKKKNDKCVKVKKQPGGLVFFCHHCGDGGGWNDETMDASGRRDLAKRRAEARSKRDDGIRGAKRSARLRLLQNSPEK